MEGSAAEAIRNAEASLARQQTVTAQVDLEVVTAVLNAHADRDRGTALLERLQQDVETAVSARPDLNTPAGARSFQQYLLGKIRDIRSVVDDADLDATSKASLAAALSALYTSSTDAPAEPPIQLGPPASDPPTAEPDPAAAQTPPSTAPAVQPPAMPGWTPSAAAPPPALSDPPSLTDHVRHHAQHDLPADVSPAEVVATSGPDMEKVITAAVGGTPIADAFRAEGITIPAAGSPIAEPVDPAQLAAGDIGIFADRHALALGNGKALLDNQIQPVSAIGGPGFIGWQHPPKAGVEHG